MADTKDLMMEALGIDPDGHRVKCGDCEEWMSTKDAIPDHEQETVRCRKCANKFDPGWLQKTIKDLSPRERIEALPDDMAVYGDALTYYIGTIGDLKSLTAALAEQAERVERLEGSLSDARDVIRHYADESNWSEVPPDIGTGAVLYDFQDEMEGEVPGYFVAQEYLDGEEALAGKEAGKG